MSFKQNDTNDNNMIHLGNYEEYFILYMDNELSEEQVKMVDEFMAEHPDLQGEFELLMGTRLPMEEMTMSKNELLSEKMWMNTVDEELLLYIDDELPAEERKVIELELKTNKDYQLQRELLMKTKLNPSERLNHPNKKELYRKEERKIAVIRPWMRVAAAAVVILVAGVLYITQSEGNIESSIAANNQNNQANQTENKKSDFSQPTVTPKGGQKFTDNEIARSKHGDGVKKPVVDETPDLPKDVINNIAIVDHQNEEILNNTNDPVVLKYKTSIIDNKTFSDATVAKTEVKTPSEIINNREVTSAIADRKTIVDAAAKENDKDVASNKGSVKGFLRKTTRLIEKRTGIDPTSNGELLIGAVAINLN